MRDEQSPLINRASIGRHLTPTNAYILVISRIIGTAIFATPGLIVKSAGSIGLSLLLWLSGAILAATDLVVWLEYGCMLPRSGGHKVYLEYTYRHPRFLASTLVAVQSVLLSFSAGNCVIFGDYTLFALGVEPTDFRRKALSSGLLLAVVAIHGCFHRLGVWLQDVMGWMKVFMILLIAVIGMYVVAFPQQQHGHPGDSPPGTSILNWETFWANSDWGMAALSSAMFKVNYAYAGLNNANNVMDELKNPTRTLKIVIPAALATTCALNLLVNLGYFFVVPVDGIKSSGELIAALFFERVLGPRLGATVLPMIIAFSAAGNVLVVAFGMGRVNQEVARQGFVPYSHLIASSRPFNAPLGGLVAHSIPSLLIILLSPSQDVYSFILDVEGYPYQMMLLAIAVGILLLRRSRPDLDRPFKAWLPAVYVRVFVCLALLAAPFFPPADGKGDVSFFYATYAIVGIGILLMAILYWYLWTVYFPRKNGYRLEEKAEVLEDGTSITKLIRIAS